MENLEGLRILIVDDMVKNLKVLGAILKEAGYEILVATSGLEALELLENVRPDLILLDLMMPKMNGFEVCNKLKDNEELAGVPVIFLTAKTDIEDVVAGFEAGAVDYIKKPFSSKELLQRVKNHLQIIRAKSIIQQQLTDKRELLHFLSHDFSNVLGNCTTCLEMLQKETDHRDMAIGILNSQLSNAIEMLNLVRQLMAIDEGKIQIEVTCLQLDTVMEAALIGVASKARNKNIQISVDINPELQIIAEEVSLINSVLNNLLTNAIKFSHSDSSVRVYSEVDDNRVFLWINDQGIGMRPELKRDLFNPAKPTTRAGTKGETGTGFGMPLVKRFMEGYGGSIEVYSNSEATHPNDHGTRIKLRFQTELSD